MKIFEDFTHLKDNILETILTVILITIGVNLYIVAISSMYKSIFAYILMGTILIILPLGLIFYKNLYKLNKRIKIDGIVTYDTRRKCLIDIENYDFMENLCMHMNAAILEDNDIKSMWQKDRLGIINFKDINKHNVFEPKLF